MNTNKRSFGDGGRPVNRRRFIAGTGATLGVALLTPKMAFGAEASTTINIGLIGCGGRGRWIADLFRKHGGYKLVALADYFQDRVVQAGAEFEVAPERRFTGLSGYKRLLEQKLDAVVIESPPYFHPEQAAASVDAGKHVYLAKPVAVDVPGCQTVLASATKATQKKLCFLVDFQMPTLPVFQDAIKQIKKGELGTIVSAEASYQTGPVGESLDHERRAEPTNPELRLRAWVTDRLFSGDIITEQNIHALDMACRLLDAAPLRAYGTGAKTRDFLGDCWDHFSVIFDFPNKITTTFSSKQVGFGYEDIMCRVYGTNGMADLHYFDKSLIKSKEYVNSANATNLYTTGAEANISAFHDAIFKSDYANSTVPLGVRSNLTAILGRTAAYRNSLVTWEEMIRGGESFTPNLQGLKS
jgi:myo-inositol 2-dehydrogenase / D-chiro-inositol 1-dehydrogenase